VLGVPRPQALLESAEMGEVSPRQLGYLSSTPPLCEAGEFFPWMVRLKLLFCFLWAPGAARQQDPALYHKPFC
jgi:hypothetical protein